MILQALAELPEVLKPVLKGAKDAYSLFSPKKVHFKGHQQKRVPLMVKIKHMMQGGRHRILQLNGLTHHNLAKKFELMEHIKDETADNRELSVRLKNSSQYDNTLEAGHNVCDIFGTLLQELELQSGAELLLAPQKNETQFQIILGEEISIPSAGIINVNIAGSVPDIEGTQRVFFGLESPQLTTTAHEQGRLVLIIKNNTVGQLRLQIGSYLGAFMWFKKEKIMTQQVCIDFVG